MFKLFATLLMKFDQAKLLLASKSKTERFWSERYVLPDPREAASSWSWFCYSESGEALKETLSIDSLSEMSSYWDSGARRLIRLRLLWLLSPDELVVQIGPEVEIVDTTEVMVPVLAEVVATTEESRTSSTFLSISSWIEYKYKREATTCTYLAPSRPPFDSWYVFS